MDGTGPCRVLFVLHALQDTRLSTYVVFGRLDSNLALSKLFNSQFSTCLHCSMPSSLSWVMSNSFVSSSLSGNMCLSVW